MESKALGSSYSFHSLKVNDTKTVSPTNVDYEDKTVSEHIEKKLIRKQKEKYTISNEFLEKQVEGMNRFLDITFTSLKYNIHEKLDRLYVQVINKETEEVIREVPPEEFLDMIASMLQHMGLIIDKKI